MKVVIVGGVAGGASTAARLRRLDEHAGIILFERGKNISFANCGIPYYCGDIIKEKDRLEIMTPEKFKELLNVESRIESEVLSINRENKTVTVLDKVSNRTYEESYDKLVLSPGAHPVKPPIPGIDSRRVYTVRNLDDADVIKQKVQSTSTKSVAVIGAGFIGLEMAESLVHAGMQVSIIDLSNQVLNIIDYEYAAQLHNHLRAKGVNLILSESVSSFNDSEKLEIILSSGKKLDVDFAIFAIGVKPENKLAKEAGLEIASNGGIAVNEHLQTSDENIYALGDAISVKDFVSGNDALIPLAGPANRQGRITAENICGIKTKYTATQGTSIIKVFDYEVATTGNNEKQLKRNNIPYLKAYAQGFSHADYYPEAFPLALKILFAPDTGKLLGAQVIGLGGVDKRIDVLAAAIKFEKTIKDLIELELAYAPPFGSAKDPVNIVGMVAENIMNGLVKTVYWDELDSLKSDSVLLDLRTKEEQAIGTIAGSVNIPLEELRVRYNELPRDKRIIAYCTKGLKSYFGARILTQNGFENVYSFNSGYSIYKQVKISEGGTMNNEVKVPVAAGNVEESEIEIIDACGLQCPGPIMRLADRMKQIK